jgi:(p)ppGpp synthase/HD superfamily hydrolase
MDTETKDAATARWYAIAKHGDQLYGQHNYSYHLDDAVNELMAHVLPLPALRFYDHEIIVCATYLHDVLEDTDTTEAEMKTLFDWRIVELVKAVTDGPGKNRRERKKGVYQAIRALGPAAFAVKLADRLANAKTSGLSKGESDMLLMYRKEQPDFEDQLRPFAGVGVTSLSGFGTAFAKIREYLGMEPPGEWIFK